MNVSNLLSIFLKMSIQGSVMIIAVLAFRAIFMDKLPKKTFVYLWIATAIVLLMPIQLESPVSVFNLPDKMQSPQTEYQPADYVSTGVTEETVVYPVNNISSELDLNNFAEIINTEANVHKVKVNTIPYIIFTVWICGVCGCAGWFLLSYRKWKHEFSASIPCFDEFVCNQIKQFKISRKIRVLVSEKIVSPLTYGLFSPVILLPKNMPYDEIYLTCVLTHEYIHIKNFDTVKKFLFALCACVHWFNPLVWLMVICSNRDIELSCDEEVIGKIGEDMKKAYSAVLIQAHESKRLALVTGFSRYALKERICAIMKYRKTSVAAMILSAVLIVGTISVFGCAKLDKDEENENENEISEWTIKGREQADKIHEVMDSISDSETDAEDTLSNIIADEQARLREDEAQMKLKEAELEVQVRLKEIQATLEEAIVRAEQAKSKEPRDEAVIEASMKQVEATQNTSEMYMQYTQFMFNYIDFANISLITENEFAYPISAELEGNWIFGFLSVYPDENGKSQNHTGIDIPAEYGTDVYAANSGTVVTAEYDYTLGNYIVIEHENGISTLYAHLSEINIDAGECVSKMDVIGKVGSTGASTGNHLHFDMRIGEASLNPVRLMLQE